MGWNSNNKGIDLEPLDLHLKIFLDKVGVSEHQFRNQDTRNFIYDFIEKNGGMSAIREDISSSISKGNTQQQQSQQQQHQPPPQQQQPPVAPPRQEYPPPVPARTIPVGILYTTLCVPCERINQLNQVIFFYSIKQEVLLRYLQVG